MNANWWEANQLAINNANVAEAVKPRTNPGRKTEFITERQMYKYHEL